MKDYVIITEATADLSQDIVKELGINVIPMNFELNGKSYSHYPGTTEINTHEFYERLRKGEKSVTSLVNTDTFLSFFEPFLQKDYDILYIGFSSALSGTFNSSLLARDELLEKYKNSKIVCIDSKAASAGEGMLAYCAAKKKAEGRKIDEVASWVEEHVPRLCLWFTVDDLNHLKRGGRVSAFSAGIGTVLNIKPVLHVDDKGALVPVEKVRGRKKSILALLHHMAGTFTPSDNDTVFIGHGDAPEDATYLASLVKEQFGLEEIKILDIGPVIGSHSGPGTLALFFFGSER